MPDAKHLLVTATRHRLAAPLVVTLVACAPAVGALGPDARNVERGDATPRWVATGHCPWLGSAYRCPHEPVTVQVRARDDIERILWKNCPSGFVVTRTEDVPVGSTTVASTYGSGGALDPFGPLVGRKENSYEETTVVAERRVTFECRDRPSRPESAIVCASADVRSCVRRPVERGTSDEGPAAR